MDEEKNVLFVRGTFQNTESADDVWDDSALIKAYDKAINLAKDQVARRMGMEIESAQEKSTKVRNNKKAHQRLNPSRKWPVGSPCRALYSNDGNIYEAIITKVYENSGKCIVKFVGYGNTEKVELSSLLESDGLENQIAQREQATSIDENQKSADPSEYSSPSEDERANRCLGEQRMDYESEKPRLPENVVGSGASFDRTYGFMPPPPPIPPQFIAKLPDNDSDALSSMLMSWYISGFHTGYYHGIKERRHSDEKSDK